VGSRGKREGKGSLIAEARRRRDAEGEEREKLFLTGILGLRGFGRRTEKERM